MKHMHVIRILEIENRKKNSTIKEKNIGERKGRGVLPSGDVERGHGGKHCKHHRGDPRAEHQARQAVAWSSTLHLFFLPRSLPRSKRRSDKPHNILPDSGVRSNEERERSATEKNKVLTDLGVEHKERMNRGGKRALFFIWRRQMDFFEGKIQEKLGNPLEGGHRVTGQWGTWPLSCVS